MNGRKNKPGDPLTSRQREIYDFIRGYIAARHCPPTLREIGSEFGIRSPNGIKWHLFAIESKGFITREPNVSRGITLTDGVCPTCGRKD